MSLYICFPKSLHSPPRFFSSPLTHRTCRPYVLFLSLICVLYLFHGFMLLCIYFTISLHSPSRFFTASLTHRTCRSYGPFPLLLQRVVPSHNHTRTPCFIPVAPPSPFSCSTYTQLHSLTHTITVFTTLYRHTHHRTSFLSLLHTNLPFPNLPHWDPNTRAK